MKKFTLLSLAMVLFTAFSFVSCDTEPVDPVLNNNNGENPNNPNNPNNPGIFKVDYNGSTHTAITTQVVLGDDLIQIAAAFGTNGESIGIGVAAAPQVGTYPMDDSILIGYNADGNADSLINFTNEGYFEITSIDTTNKTISGKFSFRGSDGTEGGQSIMFTNGVFTNLPYTGGAGPGTSTDNVFKATVDNVTTDYADDVIGTYAEINGTEYVVITALGDKGITLQIDYNAVPGTSQFTGNIGQGTPIATFSVDGTNYTNITGGNLTITYNDGERITGTFSFVVRNAAGETIHTVNSGQFDIFY
ncbi:MAG: hypothetical protein DI539_14985 [Flavobacterium psychrophilum]|nr:MAG: hypothetical protein DI539_14985 [Flavobacterium psychrophilum]